ncbi:MarR family transcriptional regulator [Shewanella sp. MMG014]|uniref:MarR family winged helix-turn-helix transcriptional regulator n=1 Tax=Shewanella sp. MMG014 TaxID=2822691 RepID=UPI001B35CCE7|nr:MarR family transcriptional regulator [Shewanella sp. MMG014]MBQ4890298.1 MarR family transcriptional regulator [Shewanella sp. MMG014]
MLNTELLNQTITEFYDKMSSWEQSVVKETGYSLAQTHTIEVLGNFGALRMNALAQKLGITTGTLTVQVDKLVKLGLMVRCADPKDGRATLLNLTEEGLAIHRQHHQLHVELMQDLTLEMSPSEAETLISAMQKMNKLF